jgi:hypothetical protein
MQTALWRDIRERGCNSEKACVFAPLEFARRRP